MLFSKNQTTGKTLPTKRDSKTAGFGGFLVTISAAKKSLRPQAETPAPLSQEKGKNWFQEPFPFAGRRVQPHFFFLLRKKKRCCAPKKKDAFGQAFLWLRLFFCYENAVFVTPLILSRLPPPAARWFRMSGIVRRSV